MQAFGMVADVTLDLADVDGVVHAALGGRPAAGPADLADLAVAERLVAFTTRHLRLHEPSRRVAPWRAPCPAHQGPRTTAGRSSMPGPGGSAGGATSTAAPRRKRSPRRCPAGSRRS